MPRAKAKHEIAVPGSGSTEGAWLRLKSMSETTPEALIERLNTLTEDDMATIMLLFVKTLDLLSPEALEQVHGLHKVLYEGVSAPK
jgi:hypothetical protein